MTTQLKQTKKELYFLTQLKEKDVNFIIENKDDNEKLKYISNKLQINAFNIDLIGSTKDASIAVLGRYVSYLKGYAPSLRNPDRKVQFRDYSQTEESQLEQAWLVEVCPDSRTSASSLLRSLKLPYLCIWHKEVS